MATERNVVDFKIHNLTEEQFQELKAQGKIDPNAVYCTPDTTTERLDALEENKQDKGDYATNTALSQKQDKATAVNYDNITNCITEIPQDIKLELADGVLTLKAGSKVYVPNGAGVFDVENVALDISVSGSVDGTWVLFKKQGLEELTYINIAYASSGDGDHFGFTWIHYNTSQNLIKEYTDYVHTYNVSFPICMFTVSNGAISSIDQVFNGFGYIGSTVFALPGVKGLIPNGLNADGTLNMRSFTTSSVLTNTIPNINSSLTNIRISASVLQIGKLVYDEIYNYNRLSAGGDIRAYATAGYLTTTSGGKITSFSTKYAFRAVDYSDTEFIAHQAMPSDRYVDLAKPTSTTSYTAPADGYVAVAVVLQDGVSCGLFDGYAYMGQTAFGYSANEFHRLFLPIRKGATYTIQLTGTLTVEFHRFVYANGAK